MKESPHHLAEGFGVLQVWGVTGTGHHRHLGVFANASGHSLGHQNRAGVHSPGHQQHRHREVTQAVPQRVLLAGSQQSECRGQARRAVGPAGGQVHRRGLEAGKQRLSQPPIEEGAGAHRFDFVGQSVVGRPAGRAIVLVGQSGRRPHQHQSSNQRRPVKGQPQGHPTTHRIPDVYARAGHLADRCRRFDKAKTNRIGGAVTGQIHPNHLETTGQQFGRFVPGGVGLGEAMNQDDALAYIRTGHGPAGRHALMMA